MSLTYFADFGWDAEVVTVNEKYSDINKDPLLLVSIPANIKVHIVKAFDKKWTSKFQLGSLALRSVWFYRQGVNQLLNKDNYDLIYFSTTQFPVCILGSYWKKRFDIPYVIDIQDPWYTEYYRDKPKRQRPKKYWFSYLLNKFTEPIALKKADGLISVSAGYIDDLKARYPQITDLPAAVIPFGAFATDFEIATTNNAMFTKLLTDKEVNIVYVGRGGADMHAAIAPLFNCLKNNETIFKKIKLYFIGTAYMKNGIPTILPLAIQYGIENQVVELTDRISYYQALDTLIQADALFVPGSDDPDYSASKIYPYLLSQKPILAITAPQSPIMAILNEYGVEHAYTTIDEILEKKITIFLKKLIDHAIPNIVYHQTAITKYSAKTLTGKQCELFDEVLRSVNRLAS